MEGTSEGSAGQLFTVANSDGSGSPSGVWVLPQPLEASLSALVGRVGLAWEAYPCNAKTW